MHAATSPDSPERDHRIIAYLPLVRKIAGHLHQQLRNLISRDDLAGWGVVGLVEAFDRLDAEQAADKADAYIKCKIKGAMLDAAGDEYFDATMARQIDRAAPAADADRWLELGEVLAALTPRERQIITLRLDGIGLAAIGEQLRMSHTQVLRIERKALQSIRQQRLPVSPRTLPKAA